MYAKYFKRVLDFTLSLMALIVLSPVLLILVLLVRFCMGTPVIFRQKRAGRNKTEFDLYKFRSMTDARDENGNILPDSQRMCRFGIWLRSTSLDELPELFNILRGDMSVVGPRPLLMKDMAFLSGELIRRWEVRPGLTGLAQVNGRNALSWEDKLNTDIEYVRCLSLRLDAQILVRTAAKVLISDNVEYEGSNAEADYGDFLLESGKITRAEYDAVKKEFHM